MSLRLARHAAAVLREPGQPERAAALRLIYGDPHYALVMSAS